MNLDEQSSTPRAFEQSSTSTTMTTTDERNVAGSNDVNIDGNSHKPYENTSDIEAGTQQSKDTKAKWQDHQAQDIAPDEVKGSFTVLLFASASTYTAAYNPDGVPIESLMLSAPMTLKRVFDELEHRFPGFKKKVLTGAGVTVNLEYVEVEVDEKTGIVAGGEEEGAGAMVVINVGDEVGIIPPVSSG